VPICGLGLKRRGEDESKLRFADLAAFCSEFPRGGGDAVDPEVAALLAPVDAHLEVELVGCDALRVHLVNDRAADRIGYDEVAFVSQAQFAELIEVLYFFRVCHVGVPGAPLEISALGNTALTRAPNGCFMGRLAKVMRKTPVGPDELGENGFETAKQVPCRRSGREGEVGARGGHASLRVS